MLMLNNMNNEMNAIIFISNSPSAQKSSFHTNIENILTKLLEIGKTSTCTFQPTSVIQMCCAHQGKQLVVLILFNKKHGRRK